MALKIRTTSKTYMPALTPEPLDVLQLQQYADAIIAWFDRYRPEFSRIVRLQRSTGARITEMFQPDRWVFPRSTAVQITPQKGNATRVVSVEDLGLKSTDELKHTLSDMRRLTKNQYERSFARAVRDVGLWRLYESGFTHPSSHFFRHLRIKEFNSKKFDKNFLGNWIGEKNLDNLNYYTDSQFFGELDS